MRFVSKDVVSGWRRQLDALLYEFVGALINFGSGDLECWLKASAAVGRWDICRSSAWPRQGQCVVAHPLLDPTWRKLSYQSQAKNAFMEAAYRYHMAHRNEPYIRSPE
jgi:hypothetical protein